MAAVRVAAPRPTLPPRFRLTRTARLAPAAATTFRLGHRPTRYAPPGPQRVVADFAVKILAMNFLPKILLSFYSGGGAAWRRVVPSRPPAMAHSAKFSGVRFQALGSQAAVHQSSSA